MSELTTRNDDVIQPFMIDASGLNGRFVRLGPAVDRILNHHDYPEAVAKMLGEFMALGCGLAAALKYDGIFTIQTKGNGPIPMMVADVNSSGVMRGYAQIKGQIPGAAEIGDNPVGALIGKGYLAFTVDQGADMERYQGIVALEGKTIEECVDHYFQQSEQFASTVNLACGRLPDGKWHAAALMIQRLPYEGKSDEEKAALDEDWNRATAFLQSATDGELLDPELTVNDLLYRLFHEDGVRVFDRRTVEEGCRCSREKLENVLVTLSDDDIAHALVDGRVAATCEFCNTTYLFTEQEIWNLRAQSA